MIFLFPRWDMLVPWRVYFMSYWKKHDLQSSLVIAVLGAFYANPCHVANPAEVLAMLKGTGPLISRLLKEASRRTQTEQAKGHLAINKNVIRSWKSFFSSQLTWYMYVYPPGKLKLVVFHCHLSFRWGDASIWFWNILYPDAGKISEDVNIST